MKLRTEINGMFSLVVPDHVAAWDAPSCWERFRWGAMAAVLRRGDVLIDVGAEHGWQSALYGREFVGAENMVLVEPTAEFWPNIRMTWQANALPAPRACYHTLVGETRRGEPVSEIWPAAAAGDVEMPAQAYRYLHSSDELPIVTLDEIVSELGWRPTRSLAVSIDVEGAELRVLRGGGARALDMLRYAFVSIHPDLMARDYQDTPADLMAYMRGRGWMGRHLGTDHEEHWLFAPRDILDPRDLR